MIAQIINSNLFASNLEICIDHKVHPGYAIVNDQPRPVAGRRALEHTIAVYSHDERDYLMNAGVQINIPSRKHNATCQYISILVDVPYRRHASPIVQEIGALTIIRIKEMIQLINAEGVSVIDAKTGELAIEYRIKIVLGPARFPMPPAEGYERQGIYVHASRREFPVDDRTPREQVSGLPDIDSEAPAEVVMEVDEAEKSEEADKV